MSPTPAGAVRQTQGIFAAILMLGSVLAAAPVHAVVGVIPAQFIAKMHTEALGRIPTATEWQAEKNFFTVNDCNQANLKARGRSIWLGSAFSSLGYDNAAKLLAAMRGIRNTEPTQSSFNSNLAALDNGTMTWTQMVDSFFDSTYFGALVGAICKTTGQDPAGYWFAYDGFSFNGDIAPTLPLTPGDTGFAGGTGTQLQALLNSTPSGGTVYLAKKSVTRLDTGMTPLVVPAGVTLTTTNVTTAPPTTAQYSLMGRIVMVHPKQEGAHIKLMPGAKLKNVWFDGTRGSWQNKPNCQGSGDDAAVIGFGGNGTEVRNSRISNTGGCRVIGMWDELIAGTPACSNNVVSGNVLTLYSGKHNRVGGLPYHQSGIEFLCRSGSVTGNTVVDATDWGIGLAGPPSVSLVAQTSTISGNIVANFGNSAYEGIGITPSVGGGTDSGGLLIEFAGSSVTGNAIWGSSRVHFVMALQAGERGWAGDLSEIVNNGSFTNNQFGDANNPIIVEEGIGLSAAKNMTVQGNFGWGIVQNTGATCPLGAVVAGISAGWASLLDPHDGPVVDADINNCLFE